MVNEHPKIDQVVKQLREKFGDNENAPTDPLILIEAYQQLAIVCNDVGETEEAKKYEQRVRLLLDRIEPKKSTNPEIQ
ncbi:MAG: hypothetical protein AAGA30_00075 [Planctomycetota bacterium]